MEDQLAPKFAPFIGMVSRYRGHGRGCVVPGVSVTNAYLRNRLASPPPWYSDVRTRPPFFRILNEDSALIEVVFLGFEADELVTRHRCGLWHSQVRHRYRWCWNVQAGPYYEGIVMRQSERLLESIF